MDILLERIIECIGPRHGAKKELAEHLGIHPNVITNWLNGRNKSYRRYVNEIAAFYGVSVDYILGNVDSKEKQPDSQNENQAVKDELIAFYGDVKVSTGRGKREQRVVDGGHTLNASEKIANNNKLAVAA